MTKKRNASNWVIAVYRGPFQPDTYLAGTREVPTKTAADRHTLTNAERIAAAWDKIAQRQPGTRITYHVARATDANASAAIKAHDLWIVLRWQEGPTSHGKTAWWRLTRDNRDQWTTNRAEASCMHRHAAERMADVWTCYARTKGRPESYRAEPTKERRDDRV